MTVVAVGTLAAGTARADNPEVNVNFFRPSVHAGDILAIQTTTVPKQWEWGIGAWFTYNHRPLKILEGDKYDMVRNQFVMDLFGHVSFTDWLSVGLDLPFFLYSKGDAVPTNIENAFGNNQVSGTSLGDLRLGLKARILGGNGKGFGLGLSADLTFPTATGMSGNDNNFNGDSNVTGTPYVILDYSQDGWNVALNVGFRLRKKESIVGHEVGHQLLFGLGLQAPIICGVLEAIGTIENRTSLTAPYKNKFDNGLDLMGGLRGRIGDVALVAAVGGNALQGYGSPAVRATMSVSYAPTLEKGCVKDADNDGIPDVDDACPAEPGVASANGCPDRDGDGIPDADDECPDVKGGIQSRGCPDRDGDGIVDKRDNCPDVEGLIRFAGCPDRDDDGIPDVDDKCPDVPGTAYHGGCPDRDGDGVADDSDQCPEVPGTLEFRGCPPPRVQVTDKKIVINEKVHFRTGRAVIRSESFDLLKEVAKVINANPRIGKVRVDGHTDSVGSDRGNLRLSRKRAAAVQKFLMSKGVKKRRLSSKGFGESKPVADNSTEEGRSKNRRVEFTILK